MRLLLDSHIIVALVQRHLPRLGPAIETAVLSAANDKVVSAASLWELAIKCRVGKLALARPMAVMPEYLRALGLQLLAVDHHHTVEDLKIASPTRDPFDRMLLAQCQVEGLRLVTIDRALVSHPLAWRAP